MRRRYHYRPLLVSALLCCALLLPAQLFAMPGKGQPAPNFKVVTTSGQAVTLDNYRGYVLVLDFFATWCIPCRSSVPHIVEVNRKYGKQGLQVLGMSADEEGDRALTSFASEYHVNYPLALAGESVQSDFGIRSVPVMFIIDKKGKVAEVFRGFNDEIGRSMEQLIKKLLVEK
jgi:cytochrome c biogenesis protein CcmG, thiol:disulfide interchange protein DsbE